MKDDTPIHYLENRANAGQESSIHPTFPIGTALLGNQIADEGGTSPYKIIQANKRQENDKIVYFIVSPFCNPWMN